MTLDSAGRITGANSSARALWQAADAELLGEPFAGLFVFEVISTEPDWFEAQWDVLLSAAIDQAIPLKAQPREGAPLDVRLRLEKSLTDSPAYFAVVEVASSLPRTRASAESGDLRAAGLAMLADNSPAGYFELNLREKRIYFSPSWKKIVGYVDAELPNTYESWLGLIHPDDSGAAPDKLASRTEGTHHFSVEFRMKHRRGHDVWVHSMGLQIVGVSGELERVIGTHFDITERKEFEEAAISNDERLQTLSGAAGPLGAFELDFTRKRFWFSPAWKKLLGYEEGELADGAGTFVAVLPPGDVEAGIEAWFLGRATGQSAFAEVVHLRNKDGALVPMLMGVHRQLNRKRELAVVSGFLGALPAELPGTAVQEAGTLPAPLVAAAFAALAEGVIATDGKGRILDMNATAARLLDISVEKSRGLPVTDVFRLVDRMSGRPGDDPVERVLRTDDPLPLISEHALLSAHIPAASADAPKGAVAPATPIVWTARAALDAGGRPTGVVVVFRDPAEMRLTPQELVKANRFESLGLLAGGIAHDFNNLLTTILGGISMAKDNRDYNSLDDAEKACMNAKGLTRQLLTAAKGGSGTQTVVSPGEILDDAVKIAAAGSNVVVSVEVVETPEPVSVDRGQILQVFQNLVVNAIQAMPPEPHRGRVHLRAGNLKLAEGQVAPLAAGNYVAFEVRDNGSGIKAEHLERIWDPFFTTKKHGTGLGLATVLSIVRKHGGQIGLETKPEVGTVFTVILPAADRPVEVQARKAASLRFGTGRILLMDDDPKVSALTSSMLASLEYKHDATRNGEEAIALYKRYLNIGRPYDAVIMDLTVIGGMGGEECFKQLKELDPEVRAIISSGYDNDDLAARYMEMGFCGYLTKPYRVTELGKILKTVLG